MSEFHTGGAWPQHHIEAVHPEATRMIVDVEALIDDDALGARRVLFELQTLFQDLPIWEGKPSLEADRPLRQSAATGVEGVGGMAPWRLKRVLAFVQAELHNTIVVKDLADSSGLSPSHFCRAFKASVGEAPHAYLMRMRLERAKDLMIQTDENLCRIAKICGLADQAHLTRLFRKHTNATPYRWRRARRTG